MTCLSRERLLVCRTTPLLRELGLADGSQANVYCYHAPCPLLFFSTKTFCDFSTYSHFRRKGREDPKPLSTAQTPPPSQNVPTPPYVNQHVRVCSHFHNHFQGDMLDLLLDPNAYAQDDDLVALDFRANHDCPS
jgi:hypothetical protein